VKITEKIYPHLSNDPVRKGGRGGRQRDRAGLGARRFSLERLGARRIGLEVLDFFGLRRLCNLVGFPYPTSAVPIAGAGFSMLS
jgi:hypothetical protein